MVRAPFMVGQETLRSPTITCRLSSLFIRNLLCRKCCALAFVRPAAEYLLVCYLTDSRDTTLHYPTTTARALLYRLLTTKRNKDIQAMTRIGGTLAAS